MTQRMDHDQEVQIIKEAQSGCKRSQLAIIRQYERLVHKLARKYSFTATSHTHEDLAQEGFIGLLKAVKTYDPNRGACFMTWAYYHVRGTITACGKYDRKQPKYPASLEDCQRAYNIEDPTQKIEVKEDLPQDIVSVLIDSCCGGMATKRARVVIDRFGLFGKKELRNCECAEKYGITKYAVNTHVYAFKKKAAKQFPYLQAYV
jgi:RNA polymerase sigma factor (sigma-70 family)